MNDLPDINLIVKQTGALVSFPDVCLQVNEMVDDPACSASAIGEVLSRDSGLTARLLKIVNSPLYGFATRIDTVSRAISIIGLRELRILVTTASAVEAFSKISTRLIDMETFWQHSVYCAVIARVLAERCNVLHAERLFISGLLHDVGSLVIYQSLPEQAEHILSQLCEGQVKSQHLLEIENLGFDHAQLGAALLRNWHLPDSICDSIEFHHDPDAAERHELESAIVNLANAMIGLVDKENMEQPVYFITGFRKNIQEASEHNLESIKNSKAWKLIGLASEDINSILEEAAEKFELALDAIYPK
ncbi:MAG: HDOD domain-containing protein [Gammaproteobacteria bacterium]|nr:HDOD domain-containing protein [Gammaproteobacteria bacterium]